MVSFRFHLVSLVAVFLALALGIGMGVTVIDKATVDLLQNQLNGVRDDVNAANQRSSQLQQQLDQGEKFSEAANQYLIDGRLDNVAVTVIRVQGVDTAPLDQLVQTMQAAGGTVHGIITVTDRMTLTDNNDLSDLGEALQVSSTDVNVLRPTFIARLSAVMAGSLNGAALKVLADNGFISWSSGQDGNDLDKTDFTGTRVVLASGTGAAVSDSEVAFPLLRSLAASPTRRVVAVESGVPASNDTPEIREVFVGTVRSNRDVRDLVSSVDDLERTAGRVATVLALAQLADGRTGHYGVAGSASASIPPLPS